MGKYNVRREKIKKEKKGGGGGAEIQKSVVRSIILIIYPSPSKSQKKSLIHQYWAYQ